MPDVSDIVLHLPEGVHYECVQCGQSCNMFEEIGVEDEKVESIRAMPPGRLAGARNPVDTIVPNPDKPGAFMMRLQDGGCCLQDCKGLCAIHREYGFDAKPNICRSFPFRFMETPGGVYAGVSFTCTAVLEGLGPKVVDQHADLDAQYGWTVRKQALADGGIHLATALPLDWEQYCSVEADLDEIAKPDARPLATRLTMQSIYLNMLVRLLRQARTAAGSPAAGPEANAEGLAKFRQSLRGGEGAWPTLARLAGRGRASMRLRRLFLGFVLTLRHDYNPRRGRLRGYATVLGGYYRHAFGRGAITLPVLNEPIPQETIDRVAYDPARPELDALLSAYFRHALFRKDLLAEDTIQFAHQMQLMRFGMIHWYAAALAAEAGAVQVERPHLAEAIRHVERYYGFHSNFARIFQDYPMLRTLMDRLFGKPVYAISMTRWRPDN